MMKSTLFTFAASLAAAGTLSAGPMVMTEIPAELPREDGGWAFEFVPYLWMPDLDGTVGIGGLSSAVDVSFGDIADNLDMAASGMFGVRKGRFGLLTDFLYLKVSPSFDPPGPLFSRGDLTLKQTMVDLKATYRAVQKPNYFMDIGVGARYFDLDLDLEFRPGLAPGVGASGSEGWWDAVGGVRGQWSFTDRWFLTYLADIGGGSSDLTWQAMAGLGYRFTDAVHVTLAYRYMDYDYENGGFKYDLTTQGVGVGLGFRW